MFSKNKNIINVVIGTSALKVIISKKTKDNLTIEKASILESNSSLYLNKNTLNLKFIENKLKIFLEENKIKKGYICFTLPDYLVKTSLISKPGLIKQDYISDIIERKALNDLLDEPIINDLDMTFDCQIINIDSSEPNKYHTNIIVSYVENKHITGLHNLAQSLKLKPSVLEPEINSLLRLVDKNIVDEDIFIIDIGEMYTKIIRYSNGNLECNVFDSGVYIIESALTKKLKSQLASKKIINDIGLDEKNKYYDLLAATVNSKISSHLNNILRDSEDEDGNIDSIYNNFIITGGAFNIKNFDSFLAEHTIDKYNCNINFCNFLSKCPTLSFSNEEVENEVKNNINSYAPCVGLVMRGGY